MDLTPRTPAAGELSEEGSDFMRAVNSAFRDPDGLRVAWRLPIALIFWFTILTGMQVLLYLIPGLHDWVHRQTSTGLTSPSLMFILEGPYLVATLGTMALMSKIEGRSFSSYYLPKKEAFRKRFWQGMLFGFLMVSALIAMIAAGHGFSLGRPELGAVATVRFGLLYLAGFILVGFFEDASFRGYLQATLQDTTGFWPAALILAALFGATHLGNSSETRGGAFMAGCFGLFEAFVLLRTGNLWFGIGLHTAWDWGETFFYSTPDSGELGAGRLFGSTLQGPAWLSGGSSGPEASVFCALTLLLAAVVIHFLFPKGTYATEVQTD
jgi:membrane protease YdiL (CAAX protease family)